MQIPPSLGEPKLFTQVLIDGFPTDARVAGEDDFVDAVLSTTYKFGGPLGCESLFPPLVDSALLARANSFALFQLLEDPAVGVV